MKLLALAALFVLSTTIFAQSIREQCENAYYATGYVSLHQYKVTIDWSMISDHAHVQLDNIIYSEGFDVLNEDDSRWPIMTLTLKENGKIDPFDYQLVLEELKQIPSSVGCLYNYN
ncbi:hypothetical protein [Halobacteriovorax sp. HLS]|uniref:hypothetical protein n=1 Tax=Halobacteriovorax sp. HLS TaxID=2234000 RepID=UPI000FD9773A|nr:hypothetical protein [Halobacteriovorax sp. HLS]